MRKHIANVVSFSRIAAAAAMLFTPAMSFAFLCLYTYCGISDIFDGMIARKSHSLSQSGAIIDSVADMVFMAAALVKLLPVFLPLIAPWVLVFTLAVAIIKVAAYVIGAIRFHKFYALHSYLNKATGLALYSVPYLTAWLDNSAFIGSICALAGLSAIEELVYMAIAKDYDPNVRTILQVGKKLDQND